MTKHHSKWLKRIILHPRELSFINLFKKNTGNDEIVEKMTKMTKVTKLSKIANIQINGSKGYFYTQVNFFYQII